VSLPNKLSLFVSCAGGVEPLLEEELKRFLPPGVRSKVEALRGGCGVLGTASTWKAGSRSACWSS
jgi:putative N6-adenine-specific DNA methylase